jgi:hypothetical protein
MKVKELIKKLEEVKNKELDIVIGDIENKLGDFPNYWVYSIEEQEIGSSGYELHGEVRLLTTFSFE